MSCTLLEFANRSLRLKMILQVSRLCVALCFVDGVLITSLPMGFSECGRGSGKTWYTSTEHFSENSTCHEVIPGLASGSEINFFLLPATFPPLRTFSYHLWNEHANWLNNIRVILALMWIIVVIQYINTETITCVHKGLSVHDNHYTLLNNHSLTTSYFKRCCRQETQSTQELEVHHSILCSQWSIQNQPLTPINKFLFQFKSPQESVSQQKNSSSGTQLAKTA